MDIGLSSYERRSLLYFLIIYIGSSLVFMIVIALLYYGHSKNEIFQQHQYKMQLESSKISREVVGAHMSNKSLKNLNLISEFDILLLKSDGERIYGDFQFTNLKKGFHHINRELYLVDDGTFEHLDVGYVVLRSNHLHKKIEQLQIEIAFLFAIFLFFILIISLILAKLFLKPLKNEIIRFDNFIKDSTHELNTPITALILSIQSMKNGEIDEKKLKRVSIAAKKISSLYNDISYLFMNDITKESPKNIDLKALLQDRVEFFREIFSSKELDVKLSLEDINIYGKTDSLSRMIDNLLMNAYKYNIKNGEIRVVLNRRGLSITNSGQKISQEKLKIISKRYARGGKDQKGYGIGLDIISRSCKEHKFKLITTSNDIDGTTFCVQF